MPRSGSRARHSLSVLSILALFITTFSPISLSPATAAPALITCVNLQTGTERISHTGKCRYTQEAQANWHKNQSDSAIASGASAKVITICSNKESSPVSYQVIRSKCAKHQVTTIFSRSGALPNKPVIAEAVSFGYDSASLKLATDPGTNADAPITFYTITSTTVDTRTPILTQSQKVYFWKELSIAISALQASTRYTFTVSATTADGISPVSISSIPVTTQAYVAPASTPPSNSLAAPAFTLSSSTEVKTVNNAITGFTISSTGGAIASYAISPAAPAGTTFNSTTGLLTGTPTSTQSATAYTITGTNASGSASRTFTLTVDALTAPVFSLSKIAETTTAFTTPVGFGYTISSTGGAIASYALTGALPAGLSFSTSTGLITGSPTETKTVTTYTITATNAAGSTSATYRLRVTGDIGDVGPGGGTIYYYLAAGFSCGPTRAATCKYLEVAPNTWNGGAGDPQKAVLSSRNDGIITSGMDSTTAISLALVTSEIGVGYMNSNALASRANSNTVGAGLVGTYRGGSQSDWHIPSAAELNLLCQWAKGLTQNVSNTCSGSVIRGDFTTSTYYWAASQSFAPLAGTGGSQGRFVGYVQSFNTGSFVTDQWTDSNIYLRPIRAF
jgi:hypothetical protein